MDSKESSPVPEPNTVSLVSQPSAVSYSNAISKTNTIPKLNAISITTSRIDHSTAAAYLSDYLRQLGCPHAYIGGFAWGLLGSSRPTQISDTSAIPCSTTDDSDVCIYDIDVLIETKNLNMQDLRQRLSELSKKFASAALKFYYVKEFKDNLVGEDLVRASKNNVLIETLPAGSLGLPVVAQPTYNVEHESGFIIEILHPGVLLLTKMKRWYQNRESTFPKAVAKNGSDKRDLDFLVAWLAENKMTIEFEEYQGKTKAELLEYVCYYRETFSQDENLMEDLRKAMKPEDWDLLSDSDAWLDMQ